MVGAQARRVRRRPERLQLPHTAVDHVCRRDVPLPEPARTEPIVAVDVAEGLATLIHNDWCKLVDDPLAEGGKSVRLPGTGYGWLATLPIEDVAYDAGATYTVAVRVRAERDADMPDGEVLWAGVYDGKNKKGVVEVAKKASQCGDGWTWVDVATWRPSAGHYLWLSAGRFDKGTLKANPALKELYVDRVRISRVKTR